jgi:hypothetical protein
MRSANGAFVKKASMEKKRRRRWGWGKGGKKEDKDIHCLNYYK